MSRPEDPIERLARLTAEENDRLTRKRQEEWMEASRNPVFPKWFVWLGWAGAAYIVLLIIYLAFFLH